MITENEKNKEPGTMLDRLADAFNNQEVKDKFCQAWETVQALPKESQEYIIRKFIPFEPEENEEIELKPVKESFKGENPKAPPQLTNDLLAPPFLKIYRKKKPIEVYYCNFSNKKGFSEVCEFEADLYLYNDGSETYYLCYTCYEKAVNEGFKQEFFRPEEKPVRLSQPIIKADAVPRVIKESEKPEIMRNKPLKINGLKTNQKEASDIYEVLQGIGKTKQLKELLDNASPKNKYILDDEPVEKAVHLVELAAINKEPERIEMPVEKPIEIITENIDKKEVENMPAALIEKYSDEQVLFLTENMHLKPEVLCDSFNKSFKAARSQAALQNKVYFIRKHLEKAIKGNGNGNHNSSEIKEPKKGKAFGVNNKHRHFYSVDEERFILENFEKMQPRVLVKIFEEKFGTKVSADTMGHKFRKLKSADKKQKKSLAGKQETREVKKILKDLARPDEKEKAFDKLPIEVAGELNKNFQDINDSVHKLMGNVPAIKNTVGEEITVSIAGIPLRPVSDIIIDEPKIDIKYLLAKAYEEFKKIPGMPTDEHLEFRLAINHCFKIASKKSDDQDLIHQKNLFAI